jgi:hypothetical protein
LFHVQHPRDASPSTAPPRPSPPGGSRLHFSPGALSVRRCLPWYAHPPVVRVGTAHRGAAPPASPCGSTPRMRAQSRPAPLRGGPSIDAVAGAWPGTSVGRVSAREVRGRSRRNAEFAVPGVYAAMSVSRSRSRSETPGPVEWTRPGARRECPALSPTCSRPYTPPVDAASRLHSPTPECRPQLRN